MAVRKKVTTAKKSAKKKASPASTRKSTSAKPRKRVTKKVVPAKKKARKPRVVAGKRPAKIRPKRTGGRKKKVVAARAVVSSNGRGASVLPRIIYRAEPVNELPYSYNETRLVLLVRDPWWAFGYWDFSGDTWHWIQDMRHRKTGLRSVLRVHNLDEKSFYDIEVQLETKNWYLHLGLPDTSFEAELGMIDASGRFYLIARSNRIYTPKDGPSNVVDEAWKPDQFEEIYRLSGGGKTGHGSEIFSHFLKQKI